MKVLGQEFGSISYLGTDKIKSEGLLSEKSSRKVSRYNIVDFNLR